MPALLVEFVSKSYGVKPLLDDVSFSLEDGGKMGVIGANGSGKTTLLRIVAGAETPDAGRVITPTGARVGYLSQAPQFEAGHTVLDAVFAGGGQAARLVRDYEAALSASDGSDAAALRVAELSGRMDALGAWDLEARARALLDRLGVADTSAPVDTLSGGQQKRVALARVLVEQPELLILDEPTNHLDVETVDWLEAYLRSFSGALLLVTHDRYFLDRVTGTMLEVARGGAQRFEGNYSRFLEVKAEQAAVREAEQAKRDNLARRELAWLRRGAKARTTKQKARVDRAHALLDAPREEAEQTAEIAAASSRLGKKVVELRGVTKGWGGTPLIREFTYLFHRTDRVGIIGPNGAGKSTLLELIAGNIAPDAGTVETGPTVTIGYYDQTSRALDDEQRLIDYIEDVAENVVTADGATITASQMLERFLFPPAQQYTPVGLLSGGERRRLYLARVLMGAPNVLLLDEPTNDLDIPTLVALEDYLDTFGGCVVTVSHDRFFLDRVTEHLFRLDGEGGVREIPGNYSAWLELRAREQAHAQQREAERKPAPTAAPTPARKPAERLSFNEKRELEQVEARIEQAEARKPQIESEMVEAATDYERSAALATELDELLAQLDADLERWAELAERA
jgi:ATP-binding cassette subfamily F protein uup